MRRALIGLARRYEFARPMINTGRMSVPNDYPASRHAPQGGFSVQNVPITLPDGREGRLMDLLRDGTRFVGLWFAPHGGDPKAVAQLQERWPITIHACGDSKLLPSIGDRAGLMAAQVRAAPGSFVLIRPDAYCVARIDAPTAAAIEAALQAALGYDSEASE